MIVALAAAPTPAASTACAASAIALSVDAAGGDFNGMSHSGAWLRLTNRGRRACSLPALPEVMLRDARGPLLPITRAAPVGMHPGPVMVPVRIAPGGTVRTGLRWVSGEVFDRSRCYEVRRVTVQLGDRSLTAPLAGHVCGPAGRGATFDQPGLSRPER